MFKKLNQELMIKVFEIRDKHDFKCFVLQITYFLNLNKITIYLVHTLIFIIIIYNKKQRFNIFKLKITHKCTK